MEGKQYYNRKKEDGRIHRYAYITLEHILPADFTLFYFIPFILLMPTVSLGFHIETDFIPIYSSCSFCFFSDDKLLLLW